MVIDSEYETFVHKNKKIIIINLLIFYLSVIKDNLIIIDTTIKNITMTHHY